MATIYTSSPNPRAERMGDALDALSSGIAKTAASEYTPAPLVPFPEIPTESARQLPTEKMLADRWVCSVSRLQRWRTVGEGPQYLKIVGKVLYRLKDIEPVNGVEPNCSNDLESLDLLDILADRGGFEPPIRYERIHAFQACAFNRSATCPLP